MGRLLGEGLNLGTGLFPEPAGAEALERAGAPTDRSQGCSSPSLRSFGNLRCYLSEKLLQEM